MADAKLESGGLAARQPPHLGDEGHHFQRRRKRPMGRRRNAVLAHGDASDLGNFLGHLGGGKHAAMSRLGALADLEFDHLDLIVASDAREFLRIERAIAVAATEISGTDLPDQIAAVLAMIGADTALAGVMREIALLGARIERAHRVGAQRAKAHRRDIEDRRRIRLGAVGAADGNAKLLDGTNLRRHRMVHPFITVAIDILLGAERPLVEHHLRPLIDQRAGVAAERHAVLFALEEILPHLRPDLFQQEAQMRGYRIVSQYRVIWLQQVANAEKGEAAEDQRRYQDHFPGLGIVIQNPDAKKQCRDDVANRQNDVARRKWKQQRFHGTPRAGSAVIILASRSLIQLSEQCCTRYLAYRSWRWRPSSYPIRQWRINRFPGRRSRRSCALFCGAT